MTSKGYTRFEKAILNRNTNENTVFNPEDKLWYNKQVFKWNRGRMIKYLDIRPYLVLKLMNKK